MRTLASFLNLSSRGWELLVPTQTSPSATTGPPRLTEPRAACHLTPRAGLTTAPLSSRSSTCQSVGRPFSGLTALRVQSRPGIGQSSDRAFPARTQRPPSNPRTRPAKRRDFIASLLQRDVPRPRKRSVTGGGGRLTA